MNTVRQTRVEVAVGISGGLECIYMNSRPVTLVSPQLRLGLIDDEVKSLQAEMQELNSKSGDTGQLLERHKKLMEEKVLIETEIRRKLEGNKYSSEGAR